MTITINKKTILAPEIWADLSKAQILEIARIFEAAKKDTSLTSLKIQLTTVLLNIEKRFWRDLEADCNKLGDDAKDTFAEEVNSIIKAADFFLDEQYRFYPKLTLTKNHFYKTNGLYGPGDGLKNISFGEFALMDTAYIKYVTTGKGLALLIAALWRPSKPNTAKNRQRNYDGDKRIELILHESVIESYVERVQKWDTALQYAIFIYIASCRKQIIDRYSYLFPKKENNTGNDSKQNYTDYAALIIKLAGDKFGDDEQVFNKNAHTILKYLNMLEKERIENTLLS